MSPIRFAAAVLPASASAPDTAFQAASIFAETSALDESTTSDASYATFVDTGFAYHGTSSPPAAASGSEKMEHGTRNFLSICIIAGDSCSMLSLDNMLSYNASSVNSFARLWSLLADWSMRDCGAPRDHEARSV